MIAKQKDHLCVVCNKQFTGCNVFYGNIRLTDFCSQECADRYDEESE